MRASPIAEVVVYSRSADALLFLVVGQSRHIAVVVVAPHQRDIFGHNQTIFVYLQHLLVRDENLRLSGWLAYMIGYQFLLIVDYALQAV